MATRRNNRKSKQQAAQPVASAFVVRIQWSRDFAITHARTFDKIDDALKLMKRVNDAARINVVNWTYVDRSGEVRPLASFARAAAWNLGDRFAVPFNA